MKIIKGIIFVFGCIFSLIIVSVLALVIISPFFDNQEKQLQAAINTNNVKYISKHINKYKKEKIDFNQLIANKHYDILSIFIENSLVPDEVINSCYKYDKPITEMFVNKYGNTEGMYKYIISYLDSDKLLIYLSSNKQYNDSTILFDATKTGNYKIVKYLVEEKKVNINIEDNEHLTPLFYLINCYDRHGETLFTDDKMYCFLYLIDKGADIHHKDVNNRSILSYAYNTNVFFLQYLLDFGFNVNEQDLLGNTILHYFYMYPGEGADYNFVIKDYLLSENANMNIKNNENKTPIDYFE